MPTLCVIDIQPCFDPAASVVLYSALREIEAAKKNNYGIVILEYGKQWTRTYEEIRRALGKYKNKALSTKYSDDGSIHFLEVAQQRGFDIETVRVIGVKTGYCVLDTVEGLMWSHRVKKIDIVSDAISGNDPEYELGLLKKSIETFPNKAFLV